MTNYENADTLEESIKSIVSQFGLEDEIIVVDNLSSKEARSILEQLHSKFNIRVIPKKSSRGMGKQIALEAATGDYVVDQLDTDDVYKPIFSQILQFYHEKYEGKLMLMHGFMVSLRKLLLELGGWPDIQCSEDRALWCKAARVNKLVYVDFKVRSKIKGNVENRPLMKKIRRRYEWSRDYRLLGLNPWAGIARRPSLVLYYPVSLIGVLASFFHKPVGISLKSFEYERFEGEKFAPAEELPKN